tara:strand:- start:1041 stop:2390 length:1350 start_codon:yes stop_codon:yes gene_type:complete
MTLKTFSDYIVEATKEVTFVFGRFNPPTTGHEKLFDTLKKVSKGGVYRIYASKSVDKKKNPLTFKEKIKFMRKIFPRHARNIMADPDVKTVLDIAVKLYDQGFTKATMVAGSDRIKEFQILLNKYNGVKSRHGFYQFEGDIKVLSAGKRDPDSEGVDGMSASKMRMAAEFGEIQAFTAGISTDAKTAKELYFAVRKGMGLKKESFRPHVELPSISETREEYVEGNLFKEGQLVESKESGDLGTIQHKGSNYLLVNFGDFRKRVWLDSVNEYNEIGTKAYNEYLKKNTPGQKLEDKMTVKQKIKKSDYYKGLAKSTNKKRHAQFAKQSKMDDDNPAAYKPAPGDKEAKTKPSKHTKKYKQMYGETFTFEDYMVENEGQAKKSIKKKADKSGMPYGILKKVFDRGVAAWRTGHKPGTTPVQWGLARVNSFVTKSSGTWGKADADLAKQVRG